MSSIPLSAQFIERSACIACHSGNLTEISAGLFNEGPLAAFIDTDPWGEHPAPFLIGKRWSYVKCDDCGQAFHRSILNAEWNERRFSKWMSQAAIEAFEHARRTPDSLMRKGQAHTAHILRLHELTRDIRGANPVRVLDFGCGYGEFLQACALHGFEVHGVDRSAAKRDHGNVWIHESLADLPRLQFHAVTLFQVLEHLDDPSSVVQELSDTLALGGILILETPDCTGVTDITDLDSYRKIHPLEHINGFTPVTLRRFAERLGFEAIKPPAAYVTLRAAKIARTAARQLLGRTRTEQYFRKARSPKTGAALSRMQTNG